MLRVRPKHIATDCAAPGQAYAYYSLQCVGTMHRRPADLRHATTVAKCSVVSSGVSGLSAIPQLGGNIVPASRPDAELMWLQMPIRALIRTITCSCSCVVVFAYSSRRLSSAASHKLHCQNIVDTHNSLCFPAREWPSCAGPRGPPRMCILCIPGLRQGMLLIPSHALVEDKADLVKVCSLPATLRQAETVQICNRFATLRHACCACYCTAGHVGGCSALFPSGHKFPPGVKSVESSAVMICETLPKSVPSGRPLGKRRNGGVIWLTASVVTRSDGCPA